MTSTVDILTNMPTNFISTISQGVIDKLLKTPMRILTEGSLNPRSGSDSNSDFKILQAITIGDLKLNENGSKTGPENENLDPLKSKIKTELCKVLHKLSITDDIVNTTSVYDSIHALMNKKSIDRRGVELKKYQHHDAGEYLHTMIDIFMTGLKIPASIQFIQKSTIICAFQNKTSTRSDPSDILQLELVKDDDSGMKSITDLINNYETPEKITEAYSMIESCPEKNDSELQEDGTYGLVPEDQWKVSGVSEKRKGKAFTRTLEIRIPNDNMYVIISLKRFKQDDYGKSTKITTEISIDSNIMLKTIDNNNVNYNLVGYINHSGSLAGGHYIYNDINLSTNKKYVYDDSKPVSTPPWTPGISDTSAVYILLYKRQPQGVHDKTYKQTGTLINAGNSCFLNAGMQLLHRIKPLWEGKCKSLVEVNENNNNYQNGGRKKKRTITIKSESIPKTVKGLKTRKKLLKEKIKKAEKKVQLSKNRIIRLK